MSGIFRPYSSDDDDDYNDGGIYSQVAGCSGVAANIQIGQNKQDAVSSTRAMKIEIVGNVVDVSPLGDMIDILSGNIYAMIFGDENQFSGLDSKQLKISIEEIEEG